MNADSCAQYDEDIGVAAHTTDELIQNIEVIFQCIEKGGLKLTMDKCQSGQEKNVFWSKAISSQGIWLIKKTDEFLKT